MYKKLWFLDKMPKFTAVRPVSREIAKLANLANFLGNCVGNFLGSCLGSFLGNCLVSFLDTSL